LTVINPGLKYGLKALVRREDISNEPAILHGVEYEPVARNLFIKQSGIQVYTVPDTTIVDGFGATPDGLTVIGKGGLEIKCPYSKHNFDDFATIAPQYYPQIFGNMMVFEADFWYFAVFIIDNNQHGLRAWRVERNNQHGLRAWRVERNNRYIEEMRKLLVHFRDNWWGNGLSGPGRFKSGEKQARVKLFTELLQPPRRIL